MKSFLTPLFFLLSVSVFADDMRVPNTFISEELQSTKLEWGRHGDGIEIQNKLMIRKI